MHWIDPECLQETRPQGVYHLGHPFSLWQCRDATARGPVSTYWRVLMSKKSVSSDTSSNETTEQALVALTIQITEFVQGGALDSRFAAKLVKRLKREADAISQGRNATKPGQAELKKAFDAVDAVLRDHDATLLVMANAALRETDNKIGGKKSQQ